MTKRINEYFEKDLGSWRLECEIEMIGARNNVERKSERSGGGGRHVLDCQL